MVKTGYYENDSSKSHGWAANVAYHLYRDYGNIFLVDHDLFPFKEFDLSFMLQVDFAGVAQVKGNFKYLWPGCMIISNRVTEEVDFLPDRISQQNVDTGGQLYVLIDQKETRYFSERHVETPVGNFAVIEDSFMHFINASNWAKNDNHEERINSLLKILEGLLE